MISPRLLALVRCPACHGGPHGRSVGADLPVVRPTGTADRRRTFSISGRTRPSRSARSIWMKRCMPTRGTSAYRRLSRLEDPQRHAARVPRPSGPRIWSSTSAAAAGGRSSGTATGTRRRSGSTSARSSRTSRGSRSDLLLGDLRRLPFADGHVHEGYSLDVLEHLSPEALRGMLTEAARVIAPGGTLFVYTHARKNAPHRGRPALDQSPWRAGWSAPAWSTCARSI